MARGALRGERFEAAPGSRASRVRRWIGLPGASATSARPRHARASIGKGRRAVGTGSVTRRGDVVAGEHARGFGAARARASRAALRASGSRSGRRASGACGSATSSAASAGVQPPRLLAEIGEARRAHALDVAAIGREREIEVEDRRPCRARRSSASASRIWRSLPPTGCASMPPSRRRATCMVIVEAPETARPCRDELPAPRATSAVHDRRR